MYTVEAVYGQTLAVYEQSVNHILALKSRPRCCWVTCCAGPVAVL